jgi:hypothetical protein
MTSKQMESFGVENVSSKTMQENQNKRTSTLKYFTEFLVCMFSFIPSRLPEIHILQNIIIIVNPYRSFTS